MQDATIDRYTTALERHLRAAAPPAEDAAQTLAAARARLAELHALCGAPPGDPRALAAAQRAIGVAALDVAARVLDLAALLGALPATGTPRDLARAERGEEVVTGLNGHARKSRATSDTDRPIKAAMPPTYEIVRADCLAWMAERAPESIHAIVTDPPYGLKEYTRAETAKLRSGRGGVWRIPPSFDGSTRSPLPRFTVLTPAERDELRVFFAKFAAAAFRVLVPGGHVFIASSPLLSHLVYLPMIEAGFEKRGEIIRLVQTLRGGDRPKNAHEEFANVTVMPRSGWEPWGLFRRPCEGRVQDNLRKWGTGALRRLSKDQPFMDVIPSAPTRPAERALSPHPSLKPQAFMRQVVRAALPLGRGVVLDPFMGGGATIAAAVVVGYESIGVELDPAFYRTAEKGIPRLARLVPNGALVDLDDATLTLL